MKYLKHILLIFFIGISSIINAQYINIVCTNDTNVVYKAHGNNKSTFKWTVEGGVISKNYGDSIKVNWGSIPGEYVLQVQEFSRWGCRTKPIIGKVLVSAPSLNLGSNREICDGDVIEILPNGNYYSYLWHDGSTKPNYIVREQGNISLIVTDIYGCKTNDNIMVILNKLPVVNLGRDTTLCEVDFITLDAGGDGVEYNWSTNQTTRQINAYRSSKPISVTVTNEFGCSATDEIIVSTCSVEEYFKNIPTAFTPNGDGKNDVWYITELSIYPQAIVEIFDRWGQQVFVSEKGYPKPWSGESTNGMLMPMDSYYYVIELNNDKSETISGNITLIK